MECHTPHALGLVIVMCFAVMESEEPDWLKASKADGRKGLVPANYVELLS